MWRRPRLVTRGHESPVPRPAEMPGCVEPSRRSRRQRRRWKRFLGDSATVERREAASRLRGRAYASQA